MIIKYIIQFVYIFILNYLFYIKKYHKIVNFISIPLSRSDGGLFKLLKIDDYYNATDPFSFSQQFFKVTWISNNRRFQRYSKKISYDLSNIVYFYHTEYLLLLIIICSISRFYRVYALQNVWKGLYFLIPK